MTKGIRFVSESPETPFAPVWDYSIAIKSIIINTENIAKIILQKEKEIIEKYSGDDDGNTGLGADSLTARFKHFNVLKWQEVDTKLGDIAQLQNAITGKLYKIDPYSFEYSNSTTILLSILFVAK